jgi:hypothetical protein
MSEQPGESPVDQASGHQDDAADLNAFADLLKGANQRGEMGEALAALRWTGR